MVLLEDIFPIFDFYTGNSINFYTTVNDPSDQLNFKPTTVLQWPKMEKLLGLQDRPYLVSLQCPLRPYAIFTLKTWKMSFMDFAPPSWGPSNGPDNVIYNLRWQNTHKINCRLVAVKNIYFNFRFEMFLTSKLRCSATLQLLL